MDMSSQSPRSATIAYDRLGGFALQRTAGATTAMRMGIAYV